MNDLEYYKALYEQLQAQLNLIEKRFDISKFNKSKKKGKKATKDYDGDGKVESSKDEYFGSKDKAIKKAIDKKKALKEGRVIINNNTNNIVYGGFPTVLNESKSTGDFNSHMSVIHKQWQAKQRANHPDASKFQQAFLALQGGNFNAAKPLLDMGADPEAVSGAVETGPEHIKRKRANLPNSITNGINFTND